MKNNSIQKTTPSLMEQALGVVKNAKKVLTLVLLLSIAAAITACDSRREYRVALNPDESISVKQEVLMDNRVVGNVAAIQQEGAVRVAVLRITDRVARNQIRIGIERESHGSDVRLSSLAVKGDAPLLEGGALIPTRTPINNATKQSLASVEESLSAIWDFFQDRPLVAIIAAAIAVLVIMLILRLVLFSRRVCCSVAIMWFLYGGTCFADSMVGYTRDFLRHEQKTVAGYLDTARREVDASKNALSSGLFDLAERKLIKAAILLDICDLTSMSHEERVRALRSSPLNYNRESQVQLLLDNARELTGRRKNLANELAGIRGLQSKAITDSWS